MRRIVSVLRPDEVDAWRFRTLTRASRSRTESHSPDESHRAPDVFGSLKDFARVEIAFDRDRFVGATDVQRAGIRSVKTATAAIPISRSV